MDKKAYIKKYREIFNHSECEVSESDYEAFETKKNILIQLSEIENSSMTVFDMNRNNYLFVRSKFDNQVLYPLNEGFKGNPNFFFDLMPLPDLKFSTETIDQAFKYLREIETARLREYKLIFEFRLSDPAGNLYRFLQQCVVLEQDRKGNIWLVLIINDLIPERTNEAELSRKLIHMPSGKIVLFADENSSGKKLLSKREAEILGLLSQGLQSKEISEKLFISVNTVNNHRQRIIEKLKTENTAEALRYARMIGII